MLELFSVIVIRSHSSSYQESVTTPAPLSPDRLPRLKVPAVHAGLSLRRSSQPLGLLPSQLEACEQTGTQPPPEQLVVPNGFVQTVPHEPQLLMSVARFGCSEPSGLEASQSSSPPPHAS